MEKTKLGIIERFECAWPWIYYVLLLYYYACNELLMTVCVSLAAVLCSVNVMENVLFNSSMRIVYGCVACVAHSIVQSFVLTLCFEIHTRLCKRLGTVKGI